MTIRFLQLLLIYWKTWPPVGRTFLPYMTIVQTFYQIPSAISDPLKNMTKSEQGIFALHGYSAKFENLFQGLSISRKFYRMFFGWLSRSVRFLHVDPLKKHDLQWMEHFCLIWLHCKLQKSSENLFIGCQWNLGVEICMCAQRRLRSTWAFTQSDQSSLSTWRKLGSLATHWVHSEDWSDWVDA